MRRGVTKVILNSVIALVLVGLFFSTGFFVYSSFIKSLTTSQVTKGFKDFITPIQDVCQGKSEGAISNVNLPVTGDYTYGIFQTKLKQYTSSMPLVMRKCEDSYCLCLFKLRKPDGSVYDSWDDSSSSVFSKWLADRAGWGLPSMTPSTISATPAPIWHFNTAGLRIFPSLMTRMVQSIILRIVDKIVISTVELMLGWLTCDTAADATPNPLLAKTACRAALYAQVHLIAGPVLQAIESFIQEATEPFLLVNYPLNFMSTSNPEYLYWSNPDVDCSDSDYCGGGDYFAGALRTAAIDSSDWKAIGIAVANRALDEAVNSISYAISAGVGGKSSGAFSRVARVIVESSLRVGGWALSTKMKEWGAIASLNFDLPNSYRPTAYVRSLLGIRRVMNLDKFITMFADSDRLIHPFVVKTPHYDFSFDDSVRSFDGFDVVNCVAINELGPECDSNTKVLMDYDYDLFLSYRVTDPINNLGSAVFCGWNGVKSNYNFDFFDIALRAVKEGMGLDPDASNLALDLISNFLKLVIGDWLLAGSTSASGLLMECVQSHVNLEHRSEYFQYWIPYSDVSGQFNGYDGNINSMTATLTSGVPQSSCENSVLIHWNNCVCNNDGALGCSYNVNQLKDDDAVCPSDGVGGCDYSGDADWSNNVTCTDVFYPKFLECKPGIHVKFNGVIQ